MAESQVAYYRNYGPKADDDSINVLSGRLEKSEYINNYAALKEVNLEAKKILNGRNLEAGEFTFTLKNKVTESAEIGDDNTADNSGDNTSDTNPADQSAYPIPVNQEKKNDGNGQIKFDELKFAVYPTAKQKEAGYIDITELMLANNEYVLELELAEDVSDMSSQVFPVKPTPYKVDEDGEEKTKVTYDVTITLTYDSSEGTLEATVSPDKVDDLTFINKILYLRKVDESGEPMAGAKFKILAFEGRRRS